MDKDFNPEPVIKEIFKIFAAHKMTHESANAICLTISVILCKADGFSLSEYREMLNGVLDSNGLHWEDH